MGINFFDTANCYGANSSSEKFIGNSFKKFLKDRKIVIATKWRWNEGKFSKEVIMHEIDEVWKDFKQIMYTYI